MRAFLYYFAVVIGSLLMFLQGFFPINSNQSATEQIVHLNDYFNLSSSNRQEIDRLIFIVIDALRIDFITKENMPFLASTYPQTGCMLSVKVESPTVTLPRIKAITTGSIPQFVDVILNLASTEVLEDSFLHRAVDAKKKIVFYGDDTWLKLYPNIFARQEGVTSFFVNDYTEVDDNVTRNVFNELNRDDWDIMFLHYLGLDHIGHVYGPYSHLIRPKLMEMDKVVEQIFLSSKNWNQRTLIVVTGDHGMKDSGGHGGSSLSETHVPLISLGIPCLNDSVAQTDIPSTLAALMGLTIPTSSIGRLISSMFVGVPLEHLLYSLRYNTLLLNSKLNSYEDLFEEASVYHRNYLKTGNENDAEMAKNLYEECTKKISEALVNSSVKQNVHNLLVSTAVSVCCLCGILHELFKSFPRTKSFEIPFLVLVLLLQYAIPMSPYMTIFNLTILGVFLLTNFVSLMKVCLKWKPKYDKRTFIICGIVMHLFSQLSSSFIEEEHQVWYFLWGTFLLLGWYNTLGKLITIEWFLLFIGLRFLRTVNQTGDKWAHLPDLAQWLLLDDNYIYLQLLFCTALSLILICYYFFFNKRDFALLFIGTILILIYIFHMYSPQNANLGKLIWFFIFINLVLGLLFDGEYYNSIIITWTLSCALLLRTYNVILLPVCILASRVINKCSESVLISTVAHIWLGRTLFFCQGHSNSLASVDIATGYVGLQEYIPFIVITQVLWHTYAFPILCNFLVLKQFLPHANKVWTIVIANRLPVLIIMYVSIIIQRHHLFVWTVFAPKLLIESCNITVLFVEIILFYCAVSIKHLCYK